MRKGPPLREGPGPDLGPPEVRPYEPQRLARAESLQSLAEEHMLFTHALLFTHGHWARDPVRDWAGEAPGRYAHALNLPRPAFDGLEVDGNVAWCYRLLLCPRDQWAGLWERMVVEGFLDRPRGRCYKLLAQAFAVPDLLRLERLEALPRPVPTVKVVAFGLSGNLDQVLFMPAVDPPLDRALPWSLQPDPEVARWANRALAGDFTVPAPPPPPPPELVREVSRYELPGPEET